MVYVYLYLYCSTSTYVWAIWLLLLLFRHFCVFFISKTFMKIVNLLLLLSFSLIKAYRAL